MNHLKSNSGFTMIEIAVTLALVGIFSAVAVPKIKSFNTKAKAAEAYVNLANFYTTEVIAKTINPSNKWCSDVDKIGWQFNGTIRFNTGFTSGTYNRSRCSKGGNASNVMQDMTSEKEICPIGTCLTSTLQNIPAGKVVAINGRTFIATAIAGVSICERAGQTYQIDMNESKTITTVRTCD